MTALNRPLRRLAVLMVLSTLPSCASETTSSERVLPEPTAAQSDERWTRLIVRLTSADRAELVVRQLGEDGRDARPTSMLPSLIIDVTDEGRRTLTKSEHVISVSEDSADPPADEPSEP